MIRNAVMKDVPALIEGYEKFYPTTEYVNNYPFDYNTVHALTVGLIEAGLLICAEVDGKVVGSVGLAVLPFMFNRNFLSANEIVWWIDPEHQSLGLGKQLLKAIEPEAKAMGCSQIVMVALSTSPEFVDELYKHMGYHLSERVYTKVI